MKRFTILTAGLFITVSIYAQTVLYEDDFESYETGSAMSLSNPDWWTTWTNAPGTGEDCFVTVDRASSGSKSVIITPENGITDALLLLGDKTSGVYELGMKLFVQTGKGAYYNLQHFETPGVEWAFEVYFSGNGEIALSVGGITHYSAFPLDTWISVEHTFNLDEDLASLSADGVLIHSWPLHYQTWDTTGTLQLGAIDFNDGPGFESYIDDIYLIQFDVTGINPQKPPDRQLKVSIYPNPATEQMNVLSAIPIEKLEIVNQMGQIVYNRTVGANQVTLNVTSIKKELYLVRVFTSEGTEIQKLLIR